MRTKLGSPTHDHLTIQRQCDAIDTAQHNRRIITAALARCEWRQIRNLLSVSRRLLNRSPGYSIHHRCRRICWHKVQLTTEKLSALHM